MRRDCLFPILVETDLNDDKRMKDILELSQRVSSQQAPAMIARDY